MTDHYDRAGKPISFDRWVALFEDKRYQVVRHTRIGDVLVSTVWLGFDHGWGESSAPIIFETMVFGGDDEHEEQLRYSTEAAALADHDRIVAELQLVRDATSR